MSYEFAFLFLPRSIVLPEQRFELLKESVQTAAIKICCETLPLETVRVMLGRLLQLMWYI